MKYFLSVTVGFLMLLSSTSAYAQSDDFTVRAHGGDDTDPPTTPVLLTADPVTQTQVDLAWSTSTDNFLVRGYVVYQGTTTLATTTQLTYSDTGLTPSTTYSYSVRAFDWSYNYSSSSNSLEATTPDNPVVPETYYPEATVGRVVLGDFKVLSGVSTSTLKVETRTPARIEIRWGRTGSYELGYVVSGVHRREHSFLLSDLEPETTYEYEIVGYTPYGNMRVLKVGSFITNKMADTIPPANVSKFTADVVGGDVNLSWGLPLDSDLSHIRVVRSHLGYPAHANDGAVVYLGLKESTRDKDILYRYSPVYYTAFAYDVNGNISSGAIAIVYLDDQQPSDFSVMEEATSSINYERLTDDMEMPELSEIYVTQQEIVKSFIDFPIGLDSEESFTISIDRNSVSGNLKSIIATVLDPTNNKKAYSYLLKLNKDQTKYTTTVQALGVEGNSQIRLEIYDYEAYVVGEFQTPIVFVEDLVRRTDYTGFEDVLFGKLNFFMGGIAGLGLLLWLILFFLRRTSEDNT